MAEQASEVRATTARAQPGTWPAHGWIGLVLIAIAWPLNWSLRGLRTHWLFFPLWLGYCLAVDALTYRRTGTSLLARSPARYAGLFVASVPGWWLFELINARTQNWHYEGAEAFSALEYFLLASLSFSTVMPAVFGTAELARSFGWIRRLRPGPRSWNAISSGTGTWNTASRARTWNACGA